MGDKHLDIRVFLVPGPSGVEYRRQQIIDHVGLLTSEFLDQVSRLVVESGHAVARKKPVSAGVVGVTCS